MSGDSSPSTHISEATANFSICMVSINKKANLSDVPASNTSCLGNLQQELKGEGKGGEGML